MKYCKYGLTLLSNLDTYYQDASPSVQKKLLGSIFTGKLIYKDGNYRTTGLKSSCRTYRFVSEGFRKK